MELQIKTLSPQLGVEITGIDVSKTIENGTLDILKDAYEKYHLLVIRSQKLNEDELLFFSKYFAEPVISLYPKFKLPNYPVITRHSNILDEDDEPTGAAAPEFVWHSDSYFTDNPNKATIFYSIRSPVEGGETHLVDMCTAYDSLSDEIKKKIDGRKAIYKNAYIHRPPVVHPLVRTNPITKRKALFVNIHRALGIENLDQDEAMILLKELYTHAIKEERIYRHKWRDGDLLVWDNPSTMHTATPISRDKKRLLYRILTKGSLPV